MGYSFTQQGYQQYISVTNATPTVYSNIVIQICPLETFLQCPSAKFHHRWLLNAPWKKYLRFATNSEREKKTWYGDNERASVVHIRALLEWRGHRIIDIRRTGSSWFLRQFPGLFTVWHTGCTWRRVDRWRVTGRTVIVIVGVVTCAHSSVQHRFNPWWEKDESIRFDNNNNK